MTGGKYIPGKPCAHSNQYCVWPKWISTDKITAAKRAGIRTAIQASLDIYNWHVSYYDRRLAIHTGALWTVCEQHNQELDDAFTDDLLFEDILDSMRSEIYLVDRTFL